MHKFKTRSLINTIMLVPIFFFFSANLACAVGSLSHSAISPGATVPAGTTVSFTVIPNGFTGPSYTIDDNFGGTTLTSGNINSSGNFSWTPTSKDIGTHAFTISASDGLGNGANLSITLSVSQPTMTLSGASPSATVIVGSSVTFSATVTGLPNATYTVNDPFGGSLSSNNINASGFFSWIPVSGDVGTHSVTISAQDQYGHAVSATKELTVTSAPTLSITSLSPPGGTVSPGIPVTFTVTQTGMTSPTYTVTDSYMPTRITNANISSGSFSWTPTIDETGTHNLFIVVTDSSSGKTLTITQTISVLIPNVGISGATGSLTTPGSKVSFGVNANSFVSPTYTVSDSFLGGTVTGSNISTTGYFSWTPTTSDIGDHTITIKVTDSYGRSGTVTYHVLIQGTSVTIGSIYPSLAIGVGTTLTFTATGLNFSNPVFTVSDTFSGISSLKSANISASGYFSWTAKTQDVGVHTVRISASDATGHTGSTTAIVTVSNSTVPSSVNPVAITQSTISSKYQFTHPLSYGMRGIEVKLLQLRLKDLGFFSGETTEYFGLMTKAAVKRFQKSNGIEQLGNVGPMTRATLNK